MAIFISIFTVCFFILLIIHCQTEQIDVFYSSSASIWLEGIHTTMGITHLNLTFQNTKDHHDRVQLGKTFHFFEQNLSINKIQ